MARMRVGVLGGTFDPPHVAHLILAEAALSQLALERVIFVPAGDPWRKASGAVTPAAHRLAMVRLAVVGDAHFEVSEIEVERRAPSYTVDTLAQLTERLGHECELYFILGEDALNDLPDWKQPRRIIELAWLAVAARPETRPGKGRQAARLVSDALERAVPGIRERVIPLDMPALDISATALRERARAGRSPRYLVPPAVDEYIRRHGLYVEASPPKGT